MAADPASESPIPSSRQTAWELEPLVDGEGPTGSPRRLLEQALERARRSPQRYAGKLAELDAAGLREAMRELAEIHDLVGARRHLRRRCTSRPTPPTRRAARCCSDVQERGTAIETTLLFFELEWAALADERAEELLAGPTGGLDFCAPSPAHRPPLPRPPALRTGGEDPRREGAHRRERLVAPVRGADLGDRGELPVAGERRRRRRRRSDAALDVALSRLSLPDRELRRTTAEAVTAALAPGPAHARVPVQHAARRQGDRRSPAPLPELAGRAQPRPTRPATSRCGADRGGARPL